MKENIVITYGTFDLFHIGHVNLLKRARSLGSKLIVGCSTDEFNAEKGKCAHVRYADRALVLESCRYVDHVFPEIDWNQKIRDISRFEAKVFVMGDDWLGKFDYLKELVDVVYLPRTQDVSSSLIRDSIAARSNIF